MDGLVSTGKLIPSTILKRIFANQKIFPRNFIHILSIAVDKQLFLTHSITMNLITVMTLIIEMYKI